MQRAEEGLIVISEHQSAGRGRRGKHWVSPQRQNLYCSIGLTKVISPEYLGLISLQVGVSMAEALSANGYPDITLKWPNDLLLQGKKLAGILIETRAHSAQAFYLVIGIGLNLKLDERDLEQIDQPAIALDRIREVSCDTQELVTDLLARVYLSVRKFEIHHSNHLLQRFACYDHLKEKAVWVKTQTEEVQGQYVGIQPDGQVNIDTADGLRVFAAAEISLRESNGHAAD